MWRLLVLAACVGLCAAAGENFNCTDTTCATVPCCDDATGNNCPSSNCTASQLKVHSPRQPCGCCPRCISMQAEGDECYISNVMTIGDLPQQICGVGLSCQLEGKKSICRPIQDTACTAAQRQYDQEAVSWLIPGRLRPRCDAEGLYWPAQRMPGLTTSCTAKDGRRLYGERGSTDDDQMDCQCARLHDADLPVDGLDPRPHCLDDGNFDELQCNNITCFCVDKLNGTITSDVANWHFKDLLPCFNATIHRTDYLKPCELAAQELQQERDAFAKEGFSLVGEEPPRCDIGGFFDKVQDTRKDRFCVSPDGAELGYTVPRSSEAAVNMTCNCARSAFHMKAAGQMTDLPQCCPNGDFRPWQCRGLYCYCVDVDGEQYGNAQPQSSLEKLECIWQQCASHAAGTDVER